MRADDGFRSVVDDDVGSGERLERTDVPSFASDDPSLHLIAGKIDRTDGAFRNDFGCESLDCCDDDVACSLVGLGDGFLLDLVDQALTVPAGLVLHLLDQQILGLIAGHVRDSFDFSLPLGLTFGDQLLT